jgi:UDP-N-acetylglucosamine 2-epimerase (non-hydrolysing)
MGFKLSGNLEFNKFSSESSYMPGKSNVTIKYPPNPKLAVISKVLLIQGYAFVGLARTGGSAIQRKLLVVFGTRPEAIKLAPLIIELKKFDSQFVTKTCVTGQHRQMLDQVLDIFDLVPDIDLNLMKNSQDLTDITSSVLIAMREVLGNEKPDLVIVHGDTTTAFAAALASFYHGIPVAHVEAGLRTHILNSPFPEEANRQIVSRLAHYHFAPTRLSALNLIDENISESKVSITGNTIVDALHITLSKIEENIDLQIQLNNSLDSLLGFNWRESKYILITGHRRENFGDGFRDICSAIKDLANIYPEIHFVYPVHLNPNVQKPVFDILQKQTNIHLIEPLDYLHFVQLMKFSYLVLTDSGGIQEEAPSLGKPVLVMRETTERPEGVEAGTVLLVGSNRIDIVAGIRKLLEDEEYYKTMANAHNPYGDGKSAEKIVAFLNAL